MVVRGVSPLLGHSNVNGFFVFGAFILHSDDFFQIGRRSTSKCVFVDALAVDHVTRGRGYSYVVVPTPALLLLRSPADHDFIVLVQIEHGGCVDGQ